MGNDAASVAEPLRLAWDLVRLPVVALLVILEPIVAFVCSALALLGVLATISSSWSRPPISRCGRCWRYRSASSLCSCSMRGLSRCSRSEFTRAVGATPDATKSVNQDHAPASPAPSQSDDITLCEATSKCNEFFKPHFGSRVARNVCLVSFAQTLHEAQRNPLRNCLGMWRNGDFK